MQYFFIVGCQRSGTTMVQQALNRHSGIVIPPETAFFTHFLGHTRKGQEHHLKSVNADLGIRLPIPQKRIRRVPDVRAYFEEMAQQYLQARPAGDDPLFGEKTPHHILRLHRIARYFPGARVILVYRDGRDVALSLRKVPWFSDDLLVCFEHWMRCCRHHRWALRTDSLRLHFVQYEAFVRQPEEQIDEICSFLEISSEPAMWTADGSVDGVAHADKEWMEMAGKRIVPTRVGRWRSELTRTELSELEAWGGSVLRGLGYDVNSSASTLAGTAVSLRGYARTARWRLGNALQVAKTDLLGR